MTSATHTDGKPTFHAATQEQWHEWLERNHGTFRGVWLIVWKKGSGKPALAYSDTVDEALCFGWIDSRRIRLDSQRAMQWFSPRRPKGIWSRINKAKVERLTAEGRMQPAGQAVVEAAKANGAWNSIDDIEDLSVPGDLTAELARNPAAATHFKRFPATAKKTILYWLKSARTDATRRKRLTAVLECAEQNRIATYPPGHDRGPTPR